MPLHLFELLEGSAADKFDTAAGDSDQSGDAFTFPASRYAARVEAAASSATGRIASRLFSTLSWWTMSFLCSAAAFASLAVS